MSAYIGLCLLSGLAGLLAALAGATMAQSLAVSWLGLLIGFAVVVALWPAKLADGHDYGDEEGGK